MNALRRVGGGLVAMFGILAICGAVAAVVQLMGGHPLTVATAAGLGALSWKVPMLVGLIGTPVQALFRKQLDEIANPVLMHQPEAIPHILYDTVVFTSATTLQQVFYRTQQSDPTMGNLQQAGALPDPQYFQIFNIGCDYLPAVLGVSTSADNTGLLNDLAKIFLVARPTFTVTIADKNYGPYPLSVAHTSGGPVGALGGAAVFDFQQGNNGPADGGWNWYGSVVIPPKQNFFVQVNYAAVQTLQNGNPNIRFWMSGILHRAVR